MHHAKLLRNPFHFLALGGGSGLLPKAPGTWGTLVAIPLCWLLQSLGSWGYLAAAVVAAVGGIWLCAYTATVMGEHDHPAIVWDEIAGYMLALMFLPFTWINVLLAFLIFRYLDIRKPSLIGWCDKNLNGGLGIMADDILAGIITAALLHIGHIAVNSF